jgi:DnaJ-class molecular chaperone
MNTKKACEILNLNINNLTNKNIKKAYYKLALKWHPDKNKNINSNQIFNEIVDAYNFLNINYNTNTNNHFNTNISYEVLLSKFTLFTGIDISNKDNIYNILNEITKNITMKTFENLEKDNILNVYNFIQKYYNIIGINNDILESINKIVKEKISIDDIIILNPNIDNLLSNDIYKLNYNNQDIYVPLWHKELEFELYNKSIIVRCIPELSDNIYIDNNNSIYIDISFSISDLFNKEFFKINIGKKVFEISVEKLYLKKKQIITLYNMGLPIINTKDFFSTIKKSNIYLNITLFL